MTAGDLLAGERGSVPQPGPVPAPSRRLVPEGVCPQGWRVSVQFTGPGTAFGLVSSCWAGVRLSRPWRSAQIRLPPPRVPPHPPDKELLSTVLKYHYAPEVVLEAESLENGQNITTALTGEDLVVRGPGRLCLGAPIQARLQRPAGHGAGMRPSRCSPTSRDVRPSCWHYYVHQTAAWASPPPLLLRTARPHRRCTSRATSCALPPTPARRSAWWTWTCPPAPPWCTP